MAEPEIYEQAIIYVQGLIFVDATSIEVSYADADKPIFLLDGTFAVAPGERIMRISVANAISVESDIHKMTEKYINVESLQFAVQLYGSGLRLSSTGFLSAPGYSFAVAQNASYQVGLVGKPASFK